MAKEELSLDNLSEIQTEETVATEVESNENAEAAMEAVDEKGEPSDFMSALNEAMGQEPISSPESEPKAEESEPVGEVGETGEAGEENLSPSAKNFKKIKEDRDNARSELDKLKKEVEALKANSNSEEVEKLKQERDIFSEELKVAAIERHPEFRRKYEERAGQIVAQAKELLSGHPGLGDKISQLLFTQESEGRSQQLDDLFDEVGISKSARLANMVSEMDKLQSDRIEELSNSNATYEALQEQDSAQLKQRLALTDKTFDEVAQRASNLEMYRTKEGDDEWNKEVESRMNVARSIFTAETNQEDLALASLWAAAGPAYRDAYGTQIEVNRRLQQQIKDLTGANPTMQPQSDVGEQPKEMGFLEALNAEMGGNIR